MLNYVWLALLFLGIGVAVYTDISDKSQNKFSNNSPIPVEIVLTDSFNRNRQKYDMEFRMKSKTFNKYYNENRNSDVTHSAQISYDSSKGYYSLYMKAGEGSPDIWKKMAKATGKEDDLTGILRIKRFSNDSTAIAVIAFEEISFTRMREVTNAALDYAGTAVNIAIGLIGIMALWLGLMKIAEEAGFIKIIANAVKPITRLLFPEIPSDHPAMGAMIMNISANMLGLSNAATPFGLKAMEELDKLNPVKGTATNSMCTFLAINTAGLTLIPATAIALRASSGSADPAIIIGTSIFGASCATITGVLAAKILEKFPIKEEISKWIKSNSKLLVTSFSLIAIILIFAFSGVSSSFGSVRNIVNPDLFRNIIQIISILAIPLLILFFVVYGILRKVKIYEKFIEGAKEGFNVAIRIIPYLVAMLVAIGVFRAGGAMDFFIIIIKPITDLIGMPAEALPMAIMRPLSGSGSLGIMAEIFKVHGPDSFIGILVSTLFGSTETTFYVLAVYFGSINIIRIRHALAAGILADIAGALGALFIVKMLFG